jgi:[NiFe] hydrogenase diaphorase moiety small subunit
MSDTVSILVNGAEVTAKKGQTIMEAADAAGVYIPRLCSHPDLPAGGHCRLCTVMVNGRPSSSCTYAVTDGLVIETDTEELQAHRRVILEMMFAEGNHYCPSCEASGECDLQAQAYRAGLLAPTLPYLRKVRDLDASHKDIYIDRDRCILCGLCVRASANIDGKRAFGFEGRGIRTKVSLDSEHNLAETSVAKEDRAFHVCPTGCLVVKRVGFDTPVGRRKYDLATIGSDIEKNKAAS